jgi:hypothetical protein
MSLKAGVMSQINQLTPEQEALIPVYQQKWREIAISTESINYEQATTAVETLYAALGKPKPKVRFFDGPQDLKRLVDGHSLTALRQEFGLPQMLMLTIAQKIMTPMEQQLDPSVRRQLHEQLMNQHIQQLMIHRQIAMGSLLAELNPSEPDRKEMLAQIPQDFLNSFWEKQQQQWRENLLQQPGGDIVLGIGDWLTQQWQPVAQELDNLLWQPLIQPRLDELLAHYQPLLADLGTMIAAMGLSVQFVQDAPFPLFDFCAQVLSCNHDRQLWAALQAVTMKCGTIIPYENVCLVINRPCRLLLDEQSRLHGEGEPAIAYPDGSYLYLFHGVHLPPKYADVHPHQWQASWLLAEENGELRRALIQGIGYARICQELAAVELDAWREYSLLRIHQEIDIEPIHLLKMTCPSTGFIHATRVPPTIQSAREAIRWVNWDIDPQDFAMES